MTNIPTFTMNAPVAPVAPTAAAPAAAPAPSMITGGLGAEIAGAAQYDRAEKPLPGVYRLQLESAKIATNPVDYRKTYIATLRVIESDNAAQIVGSRVAYLEGLQWGKGRIKDFALKCGGFETIEAFHAAQMAAGIDPQAAAEHYFNSISLEEGNPLHGREVAVIATPTSRVNKQGDEVTYLNFEWTAC